MNCEECNNSKATVECSECEEQLCKECDSIVHSGGRRKSHLRRLLCSCGRQGEWICEDCSSVFCVECERAGHRLRAVALPRSVGIFWDLHSCSPASFPDLSPVLTHLEEQLGPLLSVKAYGRDLAPHKRTLARAGVVLEERSLSEIEAILLDISVDGSSHKFTQVVLISAAAPQVKPHLLQVQGNLPETQILVALQDFQLITIEALPPILSDTEVPPRQPLPTQQGRIVNALRQLAEQGCVMLEFEQLVQYLTQIGFDTPLRDIQEATRTQHISVVERVFGQLRAVTFVSLKLESISLESLMWTLRSLRNDEMLPIERAVQSRMKEAFDFKPTPPQWQQTLDACRYSSAFTLGQFVDPVTGIESQVIYPRGEEWESLDQQIKEGDRLNIRTSGDWAAFTDFLDGYFVDERGSIDESKALPGGRYGCAQFLKFCGNTELQRLSLGRLSYMVQLALYEDLFRYQKTLLVWRPVGLKQEASEQSWYRLGVIKRLIIEVLKESRGGVPLAQFPQSLRRKLNFPFDLQELGFAKLKDLLATIPEVEVELRGMNYPYAVLKSHQNLPVANTRNVRGLMAEALRRNPAGLTGEAIEAFLSGQLRGTVNWNTLGAHDIYEFARLYPTDFEVRKGRVVARAPSTDHSKSSSVGEPRGGRTPDEQDIHTEFIEKLLSEDEPRRSGSAEYTIFDVHNQDNTEHRSKAMSQEFPNI